MAILCPLVAAPLFAALPAIPPVSLTTARWTEVKLPDMPLGITLHGGHFWVFGANSLIADSGDAGRTWTVRNFYPGSEMLFGLSFVNDQLAYAMGSGGIRLCSQDGGLSWKDLHSSVAIRDIDFLTPTIGYGISDGVLVSTRDAGWTWKTSTMRGDAKHYERAQKVVALDVRHAVSEFNADTIVPEPALLSVTVDGGAHWEILQLRASEDVTGLAVSSGKYHVFAKDYDPSHPRLVHLVSSDGRNWREGDSYPVDFSQCREYGCLAGPGIARFQPEGPEYVSFPKPEFLIGTWAMANSTVCALSQKLRCALVTPAPAPAMQLPPKGRPNRARLKCIHCPGVASPFAWGSHTPGVVEVECRIGTDGRIRDWKLVDASWAVMVKPVLAVLRDWRVHSVLDDAGVPQEITVDYTFHYR